jgi:hypothetical protein
VKNYGFQYDIEVTQCLQRVKRASVVWRLGTIRVEQALSIRTTNFTPPLQRFQRSLSTGISESDDDTPDVSLPVLSSVSESFGSVIAKHIPRHRYSRRITTRLLSIASSRAFRDKLKFSLQCTTNSRARTSTGVSPCVQRKIHQRNHS